MIEDPGDAVGEVGGIEGFCEVAVLLVIDQVDESGGRKGRDGSSAGECLGHDLWCVILDAWDDDDVCCGVEESQGEIVSEISHKVDRLWEGRKLFIKAAEDDQLRIP